MYLKDRQYRKFCAYGFLKNLRFYEAFFILFLLNRGLSFTQIGTLYAIRMIVTNLFELPSGIVADSFGRKRSLLTSFLLYIAAFMVFYLFRSFWLFVPAFVSIGIAEAFRSGTHKGMIMDYLSSKHWDEQAVDYYGHTRSWSQRGSALSALLAGVIVLFGGNYELIFLASILPYILNMLNVLSYPGYLDRSLKSRETKSLSQLMDPLKMLGQVLRDRKIRRIMHSSALHSAYLKAIKDYVQLVMLNLALVLPLLTNQASEKRSALSIGVFYFLIYLASSWASRNAARFSDKRPRMATATLLAGFLAGTLSGFLFHLELWGLALLAFALIYIVENIRKPLLTGALAEVAPKEILTSVISAQSLWHTILGSLMAVGFGLIADHRGIGPALMCVSGLLLVLSAAISLPRSS
ncbi:MAG: MFS transporter [Bacteroidetes bacterium]|nr:MAG: MFS transporter [Bacteroidota bacterium]